MHILHCTPLGTSMFDPFISRLQEAGMAGNSGRMALVLPSPYLLERARTQLRMTEVPAWEFPRILSLDELAANLSGLRKISRLEQELLLEDIVQETAGSDRLPYFEKIADFPGFVAALARLFDEFKMAAVTPDELEFAIEALSDEVERNADRDAAITGLFRAYQDRLVESSLMDVGGMYRLAMETLDRQGRTLPFDHVFMAEFSVLSPLRLQLVERLKRRVPMEIGICFEKNRPGVFRAVEPVYQALVGMNFTPQFHPSGKEAFPALDHLRRELFCDRPMPKEDAAGIHILLCPNRAKELTVTADRIKALLLQEQYSPRDVAVVINDPEAYARLRSVFDDRGIPVDKADAMPLVERALPRLVFSWLDMMQEQGSRASVLAVLKSPYMRDKLGWDGDLLERCLMGEVIRDWEDWQPAIHRQAPDESTEESWHSSWAELRQKAQEWSGTASWMTWADRLRRLLFWINVPAVMGRRRAAGILSLTETRAELLSLQALLDAVGQVERIPGFLQHPEEKIGAGTFVDILRRMLQDTTVSLADRQDMGVQVVTPETASGMNFQAIFVLGLAEGEFPSRPRESWLYSDRERRAMREAGVFLSTSEERTAAENFSFSLAAGMATKQVFLSALMDSETLPSRFLAEVTRLYAPDSIKTEEFGLHQVVSGEVDEVWSSGELLRAALHHVWREPDRATTWNEVYSALGSLMPDGLEKRALMEAERTGPYAGMIDASLLHHSRFSPSALEQYAACPFAYFVTEVMELGEWDEAQEGFDALSAGSVWHEVLAAFLGKYRGRRLNPDEVDAYAQELGALLETAVLRREAQGRLVPDVWWRFEKLRWEKSLHDWLEGELARQAGSEAVPCFFEWAFGTALRSGCDPASTERPMEIDCDGQGPDIELQGKVDRIDAGGSIYRIIDYKTGKAPSRKQVEQGLRLQVPLYMLAVESLLGGIGALAAEGVYLPVGSTAPELRIPGGKGSREELLNAAKQFVIRYVSGIRNGKFTAHPAGTCPSWCMARTFCRGEAEPDGEGTEETADE